MRDYQILLDLVRQNYANVICSHKTQEIQANLYSKKYHFFGNLNIICATLTLGSVFALLFNPGNLYLLIFTSLIAFVTLGITAYLKFYDLGSLVLRHKNSATEFLMIRNDFLDLIAKIHIHKVSVETLNEKYNSIMNKYNEAYMDAPMASKKAEKQASEVLNMSKDFTYANQEIDSFLPSELKGELEVEE